jgi:hypothetical protein
VRKDHNDNDQSESSARFLVFVDCFQRDFQS